MIGNDIYCQAENGAGKATLLVIATLQQLKIIDGELSTLVVCFSRENAHKIKEEFDKLSKYMPVKVGVTLRFVELYFETFQISLSLGGVSSDKEKAVFEKERPNILIGTPLRISNLIQTGALTVGNVKCLAIYDCDRILQERGAWFHLNFTFEFIYNFKYFIFVFRYALFIGENI